jgi:hypothetical protein
MGRRVPSIYEIATVLSEKAEEEDEELSSYDISPLTCQTVSKFQPRQVNQCAHEGTFS